jgi:hypothetical protein
MLIAVKRLRYTLSLPRCSTISEARDRRPGGGADLHGWMHDAMYGCELDDLRAALRQADSDRKPPAGPQR